MFFVILFANKRDIFGPFTTRHDAYAYLALQGGIDYGYVLTDTAAQQDMLYRTIIRPI